MSNPNPPGTPAEAAQVIKEVNAPAQPIEISLETGQVYRAATPQEALEKLAAAQTEATKAIRLRESENAELRTKLAQLEQQIPKPQANPNDAKTTQYYEDWAKNPTKANLDLLANGLGLPADQLVPVLRNVIESATARTAADEFVNRYPSFEGNPTNVQLLRDRVQQRFGQNLGAATADNLELAYQSLVREGKIVPGQQAYAGVDSPTIPIPNIRGGSAPPNPELEIMQQAQTMPLDKLAEVIKRLGNTVGRR